MPEQLDVEDRRKKLRGLTYLAFVPFFLIFVDSAICDVYLAVFGNYTPSGLDATHAAARQISSGRMAAIGVMVLLAYLWARPAQLYAKDPRPEYREKMRRRIGLIYPHLGLMFSAGLLARLALILFAGHAGTDLGVLLPALLLSTLAQACVLLVYVDSNLAKSQDFMTLLFSREELYLPRKGVPVPLYLKVAGLVLAGALLPFFFIYAALYRELPPAAYAPQMNSLLSLSGITLLLGLGFVLNGIQKPLNGLIEKMRRVSGGEYDVKTRVYFSDEIARLKAGFNEMVDGLKEREELRDTFGKYLSIEIARELIKNKKVNLGGEDIEAAVMFCDIRNFTPLSETMSATGVVEFLNSYYRYITPAITAHNGVINKFIGDAVMAVFTPQLGSGEYAADALRAAAAMRVALAEFNASGLARVPVAFGIGVHCGRLVAGNIGTFSRLEYTFIGDTVNIAARLQSKTKEFGTDIIVSGAALEKGRDSLGGALQFAPLGRTPLKGKAEPLEVCKLL